MTETLEPPVVVRRSTLKLRTFEVLEAGRPGDIVSRAFDIFIVTLIALNVLAVMLESVESLARQHALLLWRFEAASVIIFTAEYLLRIWSCTVDPRYARPIAGRVRFVLTPMELVDLAAIAPFYLPMLLAVDLRILRALRLVRLFRILKLTRYSRSLQTLAAVLRSRRDELLVTAFVLGIMLVVVSSLMYLVENAAQPQAFSSIPAAMWWAVVTLTTVGYGDVYPITTLGRTLGALIAVLGVGMVALPAGMLASGFAEELQRRRKPPICPHCGKPLGGGDST